MVTKGSLQAVDNTVTVTATDINGNYRIEQIPAGDFNLFVSYLGYTDFNYNFHILCKSNNCITAYTLYNGTIPKFSVSSRPWAWIPGFAKAVFW